MKNDISQAREAQRQEKSRRIAEQALQEREEYMRVLEWQKMTAENEELKKNNQIELNYKHKSEIQAQMEKKEKEKK